MSYLRRRGVLGCIIWVALAQGSATAAQDAVLPIERRERLGEMKFCTPWYNWRNKK
jgi:hypothetical protein